MAGAVLVAFALLIGVVLLAKGFSDDGGLRTTTTAEPNDESGNGQGFDVPTTDTTAPEIDPATVKVFVVNASGAKGAASNVAAALAAKGYPAPETGNGTGQAQTVVYVTAGAAAQGQAVASALGLDPALVSAMPTTPPVNDLKGATVVVVIGTDGKLAEVSAATTTTTAGSDTSSSETTDTSA